MDSAVLRCAALCCTMDVIPNASEYPVPYTYIRTAAAAAGRSMCKLNVWLQLLKEKA
jgi:hypothetical protein